MYCLNCGSEMAEGSRFCTVCGADAMESDHLPTQVIGQSQAQYPQYGADAAQDVGYGQQYGQMPGAHGAQGAGYENDPYNPLYYGAPMDEREAKRAAKAQMKEAKAAYNDARRAAGKSNAPKIAGIIVAVLVVVGLAVGGTWWFMSRGTGAASTSSKSAETSNADAGTAASAGSAGAESASTAASAAATASSASAAVSTTSGSTSQAASSAGASSGTAGGLASYVGTWKGDFIGQDAGYNSYRCYGAEKVPMEMTIVDVGNSGRVTANVKVVFHGHGVVQQADVASSNEDLVLELDNLVGTIDSKGSFEFRATVPNSGEIVLSCSTVDLQDGTRTLEVSVKSKLDYAWFADSYVLKKQ